MKTIIDSYNELVPTMNTLLDENKDVWAFHDSSMGYGFKVIEKDFYVETRVSTNYGDEESKFTIVKYKRNGNVFSCMDEKLGQYVTTKSSNVYDLIKEML